MINQWLGHLEARVRHRTAQPGPVSVAIRPESLLLAAGSRPGALTGRVLKAAYLGTHMEYTVATSLGDLFVIDRDVMRPHPVDSAVSITLADHGVTVIPE